MNGNAVVMVCLLRGMHRRSLIDPLPSLRWVTNSGQRRLAACKSEQSLIMMSIPVPSTGLAR
eukprot:816680-Rhodomonas_salina.3